MKTQIVPYVMDLQSIPLAPEEGVPEISLISAEDGFFLNTKRSDDFRIRTPIYDMMKTAQKNLPIGFSFMIYEAYRTMQKQVTLWNNTNKQMKDLYPDMDDKTFMQMCENFTANPHDGIGSGHQAACAIDITLCTTSGDELPMGTLMHEKSELTKTFATGLSEEHLKNRRLLKESLEKAGFINYPAEWWHFSYGDHQWAFLASEKQAFFGPIDI